MFLLNSLLPLETVKGLRDDGLVWPPDVLSRRFTDLIRKLDISDIRLHDLRHTYATMALPQGIHLSNVNGFFPSR